MSLRFRWVFLTMLLLAGASTPTVAGSPHGFRLDRVTGVYTRRFSNGDVTGRRYTSENVLKIVRSSSQAAYIWIDLSFYNGHMCSASGIAHVEGDALIYRQALQGMKPCVLKITADSKALHLADQRSCDYMCGAQGGFDEEAFSLKSRRLIPDLTGLKASEDYRDALAEDRNAAAARPANR
jgi:hypothetical protein